RQQGVASDRQSEAGAAVAQSRRSQDDDQIRARSRRRGGRGAGACAFASCPRQQEIGEPVTPDPRWLEILKASGWQTAAISFSCAALLWASHAGWLPPFEPWLVQLTAAAMVICGSLALATFISNAAIRIGKWVNSFNEWRELRHSISTLNTEEIAFLK